LIESFELELKQKDEKNGSKLRLLRKSSEISETSSSKPLPLPLASSSTTVVSTNDNNRRVSVENVDLPSFNLDISFDEEPQTSTSHGARSSFSTISTTSSTSTQTTITTTKKPLLSLLKKKTTGNQTAASQSQSVNKV